MTRLFITLYMGLISTIVLFFIITHIINTYLIIDIVNVLEAENLTAEVELLEKLDQHISMEQRQLELDKIADRNQIIIHEVDISEVPQPILKELTTNKVFIDDNEFDYFRAFQPEVYYRFIENDEHELSIIDWQIEMVVLATLFGSLAISSFLWLYTLHRKLKRLEKTTKSLSDGDLSARAPTQNRLTVGMLNHSINNMADRIQLLLNSHQQLTFAIAHEIRSPLFRMHVQLELLEAQVNSPGQKHLEGLTEDVFHLEKLVHELLSYAKMERAEIQLTKNPLDLDEFFNKIKTHFIHEQSKQIEFINKLTNQQQANIDAKYLERAIENLIVNAVKYGNSQVIVSMTLQNSQLVFSVEDDGPGIPKENKKDIFTPFYRLDSHKKHQMSGFGLGLSISKEIAELHGGKICIESSSLGGALFILTLPQH